jgi:anti-sigma factor (TIGR02949 family)
MTCQEVSRWIGPLLDGELDARNAADVQEHIATCPECQRRYKAEAALSSNLRSLDLAYAAPDSLRQRVALALEAETAGAAVADSTARASTATRGRDRHRDRVSRWFLLAGWPVALAASVLLATVLLQQRSVEANDIVAAHVRSLLVNHLNDVVSTDHHTVKPWFAGKINFSPPVPDLTARGFELVGGRLDYLQHQPVAAVVYRKHGHIINVLAGLPGSEIDTLPHTELVQGYSLRSWRQAGLDLVAISDIDPRELANLQQGYESPAPQTPD